MPQTRTAVEVLLHRRQKRNLSATGGVALSILGLILFVSMPHAQLTVTAAEGVVAASMLICYAGECRELDSLLRGRFLEFAMLTGVDASEISDGLFWAGVRSIVPVLACLYVAGLVVASVSAGLVQAALWLPVTAALAMAVFYYQQLQAVYRHDTHKLHVGPALLACYGIGVVLAWLDASVWGMVLLAVAGGAVFAFSRRTVQSGIGRILSEPEQKVLRATSRPIGDMNPLTRREMCRAERRWGQTLRSALLVAVFVAVAGLGWSGRTPERIAVWVCIYAAVAASRAYWATWRMLDEERQSGRDSLLKLSHLRFSDYLDGWTTASLHHHRIELLVIHGVALIGLMDLATGTLLALVLPLMTWLVIRMAPTLALCTAGTSVSWLGALTGLFTSVAMYTGVVACPCILAFVMSNGNLVGTCLTAALTTLALQGFVRGWAEGSFMDPDGHLQLPGD